MAEKTTLTPQLPEAESKKRTRTRYNLASSMVKQKGSKTTLEIVEHSFAKLIEQGELLTVRFFERLLSEHPDLAPLFNGVSLDGQQKKFFASLVLIVQSLRQPDVLADYLRGLGARHQHYGVKARYYPLMIENLLAVMAELSGSEWTADVAQAWQETLSEITATMMASSDRDEAITDPHSEQRSEPIAADTEASASPETELVQLRGSVDEYQAQLLAIEKIMAVASFDMTGSILDANDLFSTLMGYEKAALIGQSHHHLLKEGQNYVALWECLNQGEGQAGEFQWRRSDGTFVSVQASYHVILDDDKRPLKVVCHMSPMTGMKLAQGAVEALLSQASSVMKSVSKGNFTQKIEGIYDGSLAVLQTAINDAIDNLATILKQTHKTAANINISATETVKDIIDLSTRIDQQAALVEQTASTLARLAIDKQQSTVNVDPIQQWVLDVQGQLETSRSLMEQLITETTVLMPSYFGKTETINELDDIAFQINLLALNAAVEAARAGVHGRGFALISTELKNLTHRAAAMVREIKVDGIEGEQKVHSNLILMKESDQNLEQLINNAAHLQHSRAQLKISEHGQGLNTDQISQMVKQLSEMMQRNVPFVDKAVSMSQFLDEQNRTLQELVDFFEFGRE